jgi:endonuclease G
MKKFQRIRITFLSCLIISCFLFPGYASAQINSFSVGFPVTDSTRVYHYSGFSLQYHVDHKQAEWVGYYICADRLIKNATRSSKFYFDDNVPGGSAKDSDYKGSGYDRGHLAPAADMAWSERSMKNSFFFTNMSPQVPAFNRGIWKQCEEWVRQKAPAYDTLFIVTGPVLGDSLPFIGESKVSVPNMYYKAILGKKDTTTVGIGFLIPNAASKDSLMHFAVPVDSIEAITGFNLFPLVPEHIQRSVEKTVASVW